MADRTARLMIDRHIEYLLDIEPHFRAYWDRKNSVEKERAFHLARTIENVTSSQNLSKEFSKERDITRRYLSCIPQVDLDYGRRPDDWTKFVADEKAKQELYLYARRKLRRFLQPIETGSIQLYGGLKPIESLDKKIWESKSGDARRQYFADTWDAVRFRVVGRDLHTVRRVGVFVWQYFIDQVVRCRNYYMRSDNEYSDPYGAIHFELEIRSGRWVEIQVLTQARDLAGHFDYPLLFKKNRASFIDTTHERWLREFVAKAAVYDGQKIDRNAVNRPGR